MKKLISVIFIYLFLSFSCSALAKGGHGGSTSSVYVHGYTKSNGTYVEPHYRSAPDGNFDNNWTTKGNVNPYTGKEGTLVSPPNGTSGGYDPSYSPSSAISPLPLSSAGGYDPHTNNNLPSYQQPLTNYQNNPTANTYGNDSWVEQSCPKIMGPSLWKDCVQRETRALR